MNLLPGYLRRFSFHRNVTALMSSYCLFGVFEGVPIVLLRGTECRSSPFSFRNGSFSRRPLGRPKQRLFRNNCQLSGSGGWRRKEVLEDYGLRVRAVHDDGIGSSVVAVWNLLSDRVSAFSHMYALK